MRLYAKKTIQFGLSGLFWALLGSLGCLGSLGFPDCIFSFWMILYALLRCILSFWMILYAPVRCILSFWMILYALLRCIRKRCHLGAKGPPKGRVKRGVLRYLVFRRSLGPPLTQKESPRHTKGHHWASKGPLRTPKNDLFNQMCLQNQECLERIGDPHSGILNSEWQYKYVV